MNHKNIIITGANRGIGFQAARGLAKLGYTIIMACRNIEKSIPAYQMIKNQNPDTQIELIELDLASRASIYSFVDQFKSKFSHLNILINNAGINSKKPLKTTDGFELIVGTNYLGPFLLTHLLLPSFEKNSDNRIINLTSGIYPFGNFKFEQLNNYHWVKAYAVSKYLMLLYTFTLAEQLKNNRITVNAVDPGVVRTKIMFTNQWYDAIINFILFPFYISPEKGAVTITYLASSQEVKNITGHCFYQCRIKKIGFHYRKDPKQKNLMTFTEKLLEIY